MKALRTLLVAVILGMSFPVSHAFAQPKDFGGNERIVISGPVEVKAGESVGDVMILHGSADVDGTVNGDLMVLDGPIEVSGTVDGDLVAFEGPVTLSDTAEIKGDVAVRGRLNAAPGATVGGETRQGDFREFPKQFALFGRIAAWIGFTFAALILGLLIYALGPRVTEGLAEAGILHSGRALGWGLVAFLAIPILTIISFLSVIGIPLGIMLLFGMLFLYPVGFAATAYVAGRKLVSGPAKRMLSFFAGLAFLRVLGLVPVVGGLTWFLSTVFGLGVIAVAVARARATPADPKPAPVAAASP